MVAVQRLSVHARPDESPEALASAKAEAAAGDESWEQWVAEYERGDALIVCLELTIDINDGGIRQLRCSTGGFFIENTVHPPKLEHQIAELAAGDLALLAEELCADCQGLDVDELQRMYVHVQLGEELMRRAAAATH